ncbi:hypothetical protein COY62_02490 [bacterium (Candidatus Howlettbacteria) CG_4_10_14_0_8_um_filter_40_9]|nr:MAG: hypothetical protein COY62_02490 [bacterium (Candidatus Howlettbacteria) CG_4_10_14_0_8_um_filter_40_9]
MQQKILTDSQKKVIAKVASEPKLKDFYLSGGTALAAYFLHHRISDDLDFFTEKEIDKIFLHKFVADLKKALKANSVRYDRLYDRNIFTFKMEKEEFKTEFTYYPFKKLSKSILEDGIRVDSFRDVSANKLMALLDRFDPKDFADIYFILKERTLDAVRKDVEKKFEMKINNIFLGSEFAKARRIDALPKMVRKIGVNELKDFFSKQSKELGKEIFKD